MLPRSKELPGASNAYETEDRTFAICAMVSGFPLRGSRLKEPGSRIIFFVFDISDTADLPGLGEVKFEDWLIAYRMCYPALPCPDIRKLSHVMDVINFVMKEKHFMKPGGE